MKIKMKSIGDTIEFSLFSLVKKLFVTPPEPIFFSSLFGFSFNSFSEYWMEVGKRNSLVEILSRQKQKGIKGISFDEVIQRASVTEFGSGVGVILYNINTITLGRTLDRFEGIDATVFNEDFVFIPVSTREQAKKILKKITPLLAEAVAIDRGFIFDNNYEDN